MLLFDMKFQIEYSKPTSPRVVIYRKDEYSFDTVPNLNEIDFELSYNSLILSVCDEQIVQIWGYGGDVKWDKFNLTIPNYSDGALLVKSEKFEYGFCYRINEKTVPVFKNEDTGWLCFGDPILAGEGVKFMGNCVAFIDRNGSLLSLWVEYRQL